MNYIQTGDIRFPEFPNLLERQRQISELLTTVVRKRLEDCEGYAKQIFATAPITNEDIEKSPDENSDIPGFVPKDRTRRLFTGHPELKNGYFIPFGKASSLRLELDARPIDEPTAAEFNGRLTDGINGLLPGLLLEIEDAVGGLHAREVAPLGFPEKEVELHVAVLQPLTVWLMTRSITQKPELFINIKYAFAFSVPRDPAS